MLHPIGGEMKGLGKRGTGRKEVSGNHCSANNYVVYIVDR
jgi:hypothetical protein